MLQQENAKAYVLQLSSQPPSTAVQIERRVDALLQHLPYGTRMNDAVIGALTEIVYVPAVASVKNPALKRKDSSCSRNPGSHPSVPSTLARRSSFQPEM
jgi:hypothetical protein